MLIRSVAILAVLALPLAPAWGQATGPTTRQAPIPDVPPPTAGGPTAPVPTNPPEQMAPASRAGSNDHVVGPAGTTPFSGPPTDPAGGLAGSDQINPRNGASHLPGSR
jgi:hypothetical protein